MRSPFLNGRSATRIPAPNTFESVSLDANATARPLSPSPASIPLVGIESSVATYVTAAKAMARRTALTERATVMSSTALGVSSARLLKTLRQDGNWVPSGPYAEHSDDQRVDRRPVAPYLFGPTEEWD